MYVITDSLATKILRHQAVCRTLPVGFFPPLSHFATPWERGRLARYVTVLTSTDRLFRFELFASG